MNKTKSTDKPAPESLDILSDQYSKIRVVEEGTMKEVAVISDDTLTTAPGYMVVLTPRYD